MATTTLNAESLALAFDAFNEQSGLLQAAYRELQSRVSSLTRQLEAAQSARHVELLEKERLGSRLQQMLATMPGALVVIDGAGIVREHNEQAAEMLGEPLAGVGWTDIAQRNFGDGGGDEGELGLSDGRWLCLARRPLETEPGEILLLTDVTERRRMASAVERHKRLSGIGEMTARLAHQIRTPLASALLYASQLEACPPAQRGKTTHKLVSRLHDLNRTVADMLSFAGGACFRDERVDVEVLLGEVADAVEPELGDAGVVTLASSADALTVRGNRGALRGALQNLVSNALQSCAAPRVTLAAAGSGELVELSVTDNGGGIDPAILPRLFEPFFTTRPNGTGLGLAVVRSVADAHDGDVRIDSGPSGTTVSLMLPAAPHV